MACPEPRAALQRLRVATDMKVGIIGGSIAGCATAALLHRVGHDVVIFERSESDLVSRGAGIAAPTGTARWGAGFLTRRHSPFRARGHASRRVTGRRRVLHRFLLVDEGNARKPQ